MKKFLLALLLSSNVSAQTTWLIIPSHLDALNRYHPTYVKPYEDNRWYFGETMCITALEHIGDSVPYSLCTINYETVELFTRLY